VLPRSDVSALSGRAMSMPADRTMPIVEIGGRRGRWTVPLPGGEVRVVTRRRDVVELVQRELSGAALKWPPANPKDGPR
jgi:hypothetical protein